MDNLLKFLVARPLLALWGFVKRHPGKTAFVVFLLLIVPPLLNVIGWLAGVILTWLNSFRSAEKITKAVIEAINKFFTWLTAKKGRKWMIAAGVTIIAPLPGWILLAWLVTDRLKANPDTINMRVEGLKG